MKKFAKRYKWFLVLLVINIVIGIMYPEIGKASFKNTKMKNLGK